MSFVTKTIALSLNDLRNIFREWMLYLLFVIVPAAQFLLALLLIPWLGRQYPAIVPYYPLILMLQTVQVVTVLGFAMASVLLDERDDEILTAIRVMPVSAWQFLTYRLLFTFLISFISALAMLWATGLVPLPAGSVLGVAFLFACLAPLVMLTVAVLSTNKVEGLAVFKGLSLVLLIPAAEGFLPSGSVYLLGLIPIHWSYQFYLSAVAGAAALHFFLAALVFHLGLILLLAWYFRRKVFGG